MFAQNHEFLPARLFAVIGIILFCASCAQQGAPTGGPRDEDPPVVVFSEPPNYSTMFGAQKIVITFNEYVVLDNINQELVVSPPMAEKPEVKLRKKSIIVEFDEALKENTTYTFNFGSAIKDLHEGNQLRNYEYVFSTGEVLDSLSVRGTLKYAADLSVPKEPVTIMLYNDLRDSVPLTDIPLYVGKSDDSGVFSVNNLRPDIYKVFALKDGNYNLLYDLPNEEIGFLDSSLTVSAELARSLLENAGSPDTTVSDTTVAESTIPDTTDTTIPDTTVPESTIPDTTGSAATFPADSLKPDGPDFNSIYIDLLLFTEESEIQYIMDYNREDRRRMGLVFARPLTDSFRYEIITRQDEVPPRLLEYMNPGRDSLTFWIIDSTDFKKDTLAMEVRYTVLDTTHRHVIQADTLLFTYRDRTSRQGRPSADKQIEKLQITTIRQKGNQDLNRNLSLHLNFPLHTIRDSLVSFYSIPDSTEVPQSFTLIEDTLIPTRVILSTKWQSEMRYRLVMLPGALTSIYPVEHDTLDISFSARDEEYYGRILLNLEKVRDNVVIQLISRDRVVRQLTVTEDGRYTMPFLDPQEYTIKFIHDRNGNGKWDTGDYLEKIQPEDVEFLPSRITVRSNWDHDVTAVLEK
jgi:hypothetical protein